MKKQTDVLIAEQTSSEFCNFALTHFELNTVYNLTNLYNSYIKKNKEINFDIFISFLQKFALLHTNLHCIISVNPKNIRTIKFIIKK